MPRPRASRRLGFWIRARSWARVVLVALWTVLWTSVALVLYLVTRRHARPLALARQVWAPGVLALLGARLEVEGTGQVDFTHPHLFVANHASQLDIPVAFCALPVPLRFLAKRELERIPFVGHYMRAMGMVFIDRQDREAARHSIEQLARLLGSGRSLMAFPEGTRSATGEVRPFKTGAFVAAIKAGVAVVPVAITGTERVLPARALIVRPGTVKVRVGRPFPTAGLTVEDRRELADRVRRSLLAPPVEPQR